MRTVIDPHLSRPRSHRDNHGMTLVEVMTALLIATLVFCGVIAVLIQSRRLTEGSVAQNAALSAVESYIEQMKCMNANNLTATPIPTQKNYDSTDLSGQLTPSTGTPPKLSSFTPGNTSTAPAGVVDNLQDIPSNVNSPGATIAWTNLWPKAKNYPTGALATAKSNDLHLDVWVW
ncbi:MAG TPA: hypothetical protein VNV14_08775, partial [Opitutaceae bacterium]|nr:hypothetical protein [Opitutaceae bacterium]